MTTNVLEDANDSTSDADSFTWRNSDGSKLTIQLQPVIEAQAKHGPIFRRDLFDAVYVTWQSIKDQTIEGQQFPKTKGVESSPWEAYPIPDVYGIEGTVWVEREGVVEKNGKKLVTQRKWGYNSLQDLGMRYAMDESLTPFTFCWHYVEIEEQACFTESEVCSREAQLKDEWLSSDFCRRLTSFLEEHAGRTMVHVDKIICFGLGCLSQGWQDRSTCRSYVQHLAALTVRDILTRKQGDSAPMVYAQDPRYCAAGISYLNKRFDISVLEDPEGFRALDGHTFVITVAPDIPVEQIAIGLTHEEHGPAAMLCNAVLTDGLEYDGKSSYRTSDPSPAVWEYKQNSLWMEYDDEEEANAFGNIGLYLKKKE